MSSQFNRARLHKACLALIFASMALLALAGLVAADKAVGKAPDSLRTIVVNFWGDKPDQSKDDGICLTADGNCTLRAALDEANYDPATRDTIRFNIPLPATINLQSELVISGSVTIEGPGTDRLTVSAGGKDRHFDVRTAANTFDSPVTISNLTLSNGQTGGSGGSISFIHYSDSGGQPQSLTLNSIAFRNNSAIDGSGGAIFASRGIYSSAELNLTLNGVVFDGNSTPGLGGAIDMELPGVVHVADAEFINNQSDGGGGAIFLGSESKGEVMRTSFANNSALPNEGGAIFNYGTLTVSDSIANANRAGGGGAIWNYGTLTVDHSNFNGNLTVAPAEASGCPFDGGAISNWGVLRVNESSFDGNQSSCAGGAISNELTEGPAANATITGTIFQANEATTGGAIYNDASLSAENSSFVGNEANWGGALENSGVVDVSRSSVSANRAYATCIRSLVDPPYVQPFACGRGGGIDNSGTLKVRQSTFSENLSNDRGGAIANEGDPTGSDVAITSSTLSGNKAPQGGGISNFSFSNISSPPSPGGLATVFMDHVTIAANRSVLGGGVLNQGEMPIPIIGSASRDNASLGVMAVFSSTNSIIAGNIESETGNYSDCITAGIASFASLDYNLTGNGTSLGCSFSKPNDRTVDTTSVFTDVFAQRLVANGGPTKTHALFSHSPAIDQIPVGTSGCGTPGDTDQRGVPRPVGSKCDIGAYESIPMGIRLYVTAVGTEQDALRTVTATVTYLAGLNTPVAGQLLGFEVTGGTTYGPITDTTKTNGKAVFHYRSVLPQSQRPSTYTQTPAQPASAQEAQTLMDYIHVWADQNGNSAYDAGEPDFLVDLPTVITLVSFIVRPNTDGTVTLAWTTAVETDNAGFNLYRAIASEGPLVKINDELIASKGAFGGEYGYVDSPPGPGVYDYWLEDVDYNGMTAFHKPIEVRVADVGELHSLYLPQLIR